MHLPETPTHKLRMLNSCPTRHRKSWAVMIRRKLYNNHIRHANDLMCVVLIRKADILKSLIPTESLLYKHGGPSPPLRLHRLDLGQGANEIAQKPWERFQAALRPTATPTAAAAAAAATDATAALA